MSIPAEKIEGLQYGLFDDIPAEIYHGDRSAVSKHWLDLIERSPAHLRLHLDEPIEKDSEALIFGGLLHTMILEPDLIDQEYIVSPKLDKRTKKGKEQFAEIEEKANGRIIIVDHLFDKAKAMATAARNHSKAKKILANGKAEVTKVWNDDESGEKCKARADWIHADCLLVDVKTTMDARHDKFVRDLINYRYDVQSGHYTDGFEIDKFLFFVIEKEPPYGVSLFVADHEIIQRGKTIRDHNLMQYAQCRIKNEWPCYTNEIQTLNLPPWARSINYE